MKKKNTVMFKTVDPQFTPSKGSEGSAGFDVYSTSFALLEPGGRALISVGVCLQLPPGMFALLLPRSGLASNSGVVATTGVIDNDYRGLIKANLVNLSRSSSYSVNVGDRIAQLVFLEYPELSLKPVDSLSLTLRDVNGFGSTGK